MTKTDFLFATPSFIGGMAYALDLGSTLTQYNTKSSPELADYFAVSSDWIVTGNDIWAACSSFHQENYGKEK